MSDLPDFQLLTSFTISRDVTSDIPLSKELTFLNPNDGVLAIGAILNQRSWRRVGFIYPNYDYIPVTGDRLVGSAALLRQSTDYADFQVFTFPFRLIGFRLACHPWIDSCSCEVYLGKIN